MAIPRDDFGSMSIGSAMASQLGRCGTSDHPAELQLDRQNCLELTRPGKHTKSDMENRPVEIVDLPSYKLVDLSIVT